MLRALIVITMFVSSSAHAAVLSCTVADYKATRGEDRSSVNSDFNEPGKQFTVDTSEDGWKISDANYSYSSEKISNETPLKIYASVNRQTGQYEKRVYYGTVGASYELKAICKKAEFKANM